MVKRDGLLKLFHAPVKFCLTILNGQIAIVNLQRISQDSRSPQVVDAFDFRFCQGSNI